MASYNFFQCTMSKQVAGWLLRYLQSEKWQTDMYVEDDIIGKTVQVGNDQEKAQSEIPRKSQLTIMYSY